MMCAGHDDKMTALDRPRPCQAGFDGALNVADTHANVTLDRVAFSASASNHPMAVHTVTSGIAAICEEEEPIET